MSGAVSNIYDTLSSDGTKGLSCSLVEYETVYFGI